MNMFGGAFVAFIAVVWVIRILFFDEPGKLPISEEVESVERGSCPDCSSCCPESVRKVGPNGFWTDFRCPNCGYKLTAHVSGSSGE
jgi:DNA-directed RNA polymerase subunit RPC12/RpoP